MYTATHLMAPPSILLRITYGMDLMTVSFHQTSRTCGLSVLLSASVFLGTPTLLPLTSRNLYSLTYTARNTDGLRKCIVGFGHHGPEHPRSAILQGQKRPARASIATIYPENGAYPVFSFSATVCCLPTWKKQLINHTSGDELLVTLGSASHRGSLS